MPQVSNLIIKLQSGTDSTYFATWSFDSKTTITTPGGVKVGDYVTVKAGSTWYNGVAISKFVFGDSWQVIQITGTRAVLGRNRSGSNNITSPIHINNLVGGSGGTSTTVDSIDHYKAVWAYDTGDGVWFSGGSSDVTEKQVTYNGPSNATSIRVTVTPVSKTREVNGTETAYWTGTAVSATYSPSVNPPEVPPTPTVAIDKYELTATVDNVSDPRSDEIQFEVYDVTKLINTGTTTITACMASFKCAVNAGGSYRVRARSANLVGTNRVYSTWTNFTNGMTTIPSAPSGITTIRGSSKTSIYVEWTVVNSAKTYDIEYTTKLNYFDGSNKTTKVSGIESNHYEVTGLESGEEYFFRVRAVNEKGESGWTDIKSVVIGKEPAAPTTWSSATTVVTGDVLNLYWVHNSEDGSSETYAEVEITIGSDRQTYTIKNEDLGDEDKEDKTKHYTVNTSSYKEGTQIKWRVRTAGITKVYGAWSIQRTVDVYAPPTLNLSITNQNGDLVQVLTSFPFFIEGLAGPATQIPIGYHVTITADEGYETVDNVGRSRIVNPGDAVYSRYIDTNDPLLVAMSAGNVDLENNIPYTVTVVVSMNSGLTTEQTQTFDVSWTDEQYNLDAEIGIDKDTFVAYITPYCRDANGAPIPDMTLSVYRREFDGTFTKLSDNIDSVKNTVVTDPHPSLDYARYRIVAVANNTGAVSFYDPPGYPIGGSSIILQWEEEWTNFDVTSTDETVRPLWTGSILTLPYNVDVSDNVKPDATLVKYVGRTYPVSYYGTQIDSSSTWNAVIDKNDQETIYALRRLAIWKGDVYVREPSGSGYWANLTVTFNKKHDDLTIPVTLDISRVTGGI